MTQIEKFEAIEGIASEVRQARSAIISNSGFIVAYGKSYECLCRLSGRPVALRVSGPIFIEPGETIRVVGRQNWNGVFEAVAYHNQSSGASGNSDHSFAQRLFDKFTATIYVLGMTLLVIGLITSSMFIHGISDLLFVVCAFFGLLLIIGLTMFMRHRSGISAIAKLLNCASPSQP